MKHTIFVLAALALVLAACGGGQAPAVPTATFTLATKTPAPTVAPTEAATNTPEPTLDLTATADAENAAAMAQVAAYIQPDLEMAGYSLDIGDLTFLQSEEYTYSNTTPSLQWATDVDPTYSAGNFVMGVDITWNTSGWATCGIIFRAQDDVQRGERAQFEAIRISGAPAFDIGLYKFNQFEASLLGGSRSNSVINLDNESTNHYVIAANGTSVTVYGNGERLAKTDLKASMTSGLFGFTGWEDSGTALCTYNNLWIWELP